jgi:hypothetical protein
MKRNARKNTNGKKVPAHRRIVLTVGELIAAVYEATPGLGAKKLARAKEVLTHSALADHLNPHLRFV